MKNPYSFLPYLPDHKIAWDHFITQSKNATFLHQRSFMDYHSDRFQDHSLIIKKEEKLVAVLPAHIVNDEVYSHQGLTYAGLLLSKKIKLVEVFNIFYGLLEYLMHQGVETLYLKLVPSFYSVLPSEEVEYLLQLVNAHQYRLDAASVIDLSQPVALQSNRMEGVKKAVKSGLVIQEEHSFDDFWNLILIPNLKKKHDAKPIHSLDEIRLLHDLFPKNIRQFNVYHEGKVVGGATVFETRTTAHVQYISGNDSKQELGTLDYLFHSLINETFSKKQYFDFGTSNENQGKNLNKGLSYWKECFGARTFVHRFYKVETKNHSFLKDVLL